MPPFTVSQATALIPLLQREMESLQPSYQSLKQIWEETADSLELEIDSPNVRQHCLQDARAMRALQQIEASLAFFEALGVECRGIEDGIFEFPCLVWDRFVLLSWQMDDETIAYWHEVDVDFLRRRPLIELAQTSVLEHESYALN